MKSPFTIRDADDGGLGMHLVQFKDDSDGRALAAGRGPKGAAAEFLQRALITASEVLSRAEIETLVDAHFILSGDPQ